MWVLVALTVGGELFGVMGMLVMIPLASVLYALLREFTIARVAERNIPVEKLMDHPPELKSKFKEKRERRREQRLLNRMKEMAEKHAPDLGKKKK
jgi:biopolymer transport protein ExbB/TolQ